jgi:hypothetical protein
MTTSPGPDSDKAVPTIVEDLFLTAAFLIKGRLANKYHRLTKVLEDSDRTFLQIEDATMVSLRGGEVIRTPSVLVNRDEIIFAHELVDTAGDYVQKQLASGEKLQRIRAFYSGTVQLELSGKIRPKAYEPTDAGKWYFIMREPSVRGLSLDHDELRVLKSLPYVIVRKKKLAYIYDFGG